MDTAPAGRRIELRSSSMVSPPALSNCTASTSWLRDHFPGFPLAGSWLSVAHADSVVRTGSYYTDGPAGDLFYQVLNRPDLQEMSA